MIADASNQISGIYWNVYGKIDSIARKPGSLMNDMEFHYNAMGNRTCKIVKPRTPAGNRKTQDQWQYTYYVHDASGNIMATYTKKFVQPSAYQGTYSPIGNLQDVSFNKETNSIYGCARIGEKIYTNSDNALASAVLDVNPTLNVNQTYSINAIAAYSQFLRPATASNSTRILTEKTYELTNHLGNVMATIYDRKLPVQSTTNASVAINYIPDVASTTDYYAFVAELTGRSFNSKSARYGLWGQEKLNELEGEGDNYLTFFRLLDTRIGRWLEIDPKPDASESPYANSHNNGERYNDPAGDCADCKTEAKASVSLTFGTKNQSRINFAVAIGASKMSGSLMGSTNLSLNVYNGGPGTNQASTGMNTWGGALTLGISGTLGGGSGTPTELNIFNSSTLSAVSNSFGNSVTLGTNLTLNSATGFNRAGGYAGKLGGFTMNINEDYSFLPRGGILASGKDEAETGGGQAGFTFKNGSSLTFGAEVFTGKPSSYPKQSTVFPGFVDQTLDQQLLNVGRTFLKLDNVPNIGNYRLDFSGSGSMYPKNSIHNLLGYDLFQSSAVNSFQITH